MRVIRRDEQHSKCVLENQSSAHTAICRPPSFQLAEGLQQTAGWHNYNHPHIAGQQVHTAGHVCCCRTDLAQHGDFTHKGDCHQIIDGDRLNGLLCGHKQKVSLLSTFTQKLVEIKVAERKQI